MEYPLMPELILDVLETREIINEFTEFLTFADGQEQGTVCQFELYPGIWLWLIDFRMYKIPARMIQDYHYLKLNYCIEGRCEVKLPRDRYVYLETGMVSLDLNQPQAAFCNPNGCYRGIEVVFDLEVLKTKYPAALRDLGVDLSGLSDWLRMKHGSYLGIAPDGFHTLALAVLGLKYEEQRQQEVKQEDLRFYLVAFLRKLSVDAIESRRITRTLTKGQRSIAAQAKELLCRDLSCRYTVEQLAEWSGVSPSSLKKYFEQMYGESISSYMRKERMQQAKQLLQETDNSIALIAEQTGYENQSKFGTVFKQYTGAAPLEYRRLERRRGI
ncbi:MAG: helix-turn-helix transcriptional regulator [Lachnospiraceae bacterium]